MVVNCGVSTEGECMAELWGGGLRYEEESIDEKEVCYGARRIEYDCRVLGDCDNEQGRNIVVHTVV